MGPLTQGILASLIANGLTGFLAHLMPEPAWTARLDQSLRTLLQEDPSLGTILQKTVTSVAKTVQMADEKKAESIRLFLVSPDAESIVRQIYATRLTSDRDENFSSLIDAEFQSSLALWLGESEASVRDLAQMLLGALVESCDRALTKAIEKGILSAHEAASVVRHRLVLDELLTIRRNLDLLQQPRKPDIKEILDFETKYRQQVKARHAYITPPHFDAARKLPIDDIYVAPNFVKGRSQKGEGQEPFGLVEFLSSIYRAVLLGNPGGGKSTLVAKLCHDLASRYKQRLFGGRLVLPILVVLRDYGSEKKAQRCSVLQFIEAVQLLFSMVWTSS